MPAVARAPRPRRLRGRGPPPPQSRGPAGRAQRGPVPVPPDPTLEEIQLFVPGFRVDKCSGKPVPRTPRTIVLMFISYHDVFHPPMRSASMSFDVDRSIQTFPERKEEFKQRHRISYVQVKRRSIVLSSAWWDGRNDLISTPCVTPLGFIMTARCPRRIPHPAVVGRASAHCQW